MDFVVWGYYALICAGLSLAAPVLSTAFLRVTAGAVVGIVAAALLPVLRGWFG